MIHFQFFFFKKNTSWIPKRKKGLIQSHTCFIWMIDIEIQSLTNKFFSVNIAMKFGLNVLVLPLGEMGSICGINKNK